MEEPVAPSPDSAPSRESRAELVGRFRLAHGLQDLPAADFDLALTHRSHAFEAGLPADNERLEFLGDAVLGLVVSEFLFSGDPEATEGQLSKRRARLVSRAVLGERAQELGIGEILLLGRGERESGGARRSSVLGSALEALVGAIYLHYGFDFARRFILAHVLSSRSTPHQDQVGDEDFKSALQEWAQREYKLLPVYTRLAEEGPPHERTFSVRVEVAGRVLAEGHGSRVKAAENEAARLALDRLRREA